MILMPMPGMPEILIPMKNGKNKPLSIRAHLGIIAIITLALFTATMIASADYRPYSGRNSVEAGRTHDGEYLDCDLLEKDHIPNIGSKVDGAGMCVMSSIEMAARFCGMDQYRGLRDWCASEEGGAYPSKVDKQLAAFCKAKNLPPPQYVQYEGPEPGPIVEASLSSGRMACITYGWSPRYGKQIAHMVNLVKFGGKYATVLDNNFTGVNRYEWMDREELLRRLGYPRNKGWVFVWLAPPPPASPRNIK